MKLYDECLIFFLKKNGCIDALPSTIQNDIFVLRNLYQIKRQYAEKAEFLECWAFSHSLWWQDKLENIGTVCFEWDSCQACYKWKEIEEEKKRGDVALEKFSEELAKLRDDVKDASTGCKIVSVKKYLFPIQARKKLMSWAWCLFSPYTGTF